MFFFAACDEPTKAKPEEPKETNTAAQKTDGASKQPKTQPTSAAKAAPLEATGPVAKVNGKEITAAQFNDEVSKMMKMMPVFPPGQAQAMKGRILDNLISKHLIDIATAPQMDSVPAADIDKEFAKFAENAKSMPGGMQQFFQRMDLTEETFKVELKKSLALKEALDKKYGIAATDADVKKFYNDNKKRFEEPDQVQASHILFKVEKTATPDQAEAAKKKADDVYKQAKAKDADFAELAKQHSEGPSGPRGGELGFFTKDKMVPPFADAAWKLKKGAVSKPVKTQFGWHIIKVTDKKKARTVPFNEVSEKIKDQLEQGKMKEVVQKYITELKAGAKIEKMEQNIKVNETKGAQSPMMPNFGGKMPNQKMKLQMPKGGDGNKLKLTPPGK